MHYSPRRIKRGQDWWVFEASSSHGISINDFIGDLLTALIVRYLTGRFIGEYYSGGDVIYRHSFAYFGSLSASYDIVDASDYRDAADSGDLLRWTERNGAFIVVYSVTDAGSLVKAAEILDCLPRLAPKFLLASKLDLQHRRQVCYHQLDWSCSVWLNESFDLFRWTRKMVRG